MRNKNADEILKNIEIASPCSANWDDMVGDERLRFCGSCEKNVYNFSEMSKAEITQLLTANNYNVCGRFYRRADGTILTDDCPVGLRAVRKACGQMYKRIAAGIVLVLSIFASQAARADSSVQFCDMENDANIETKQDIWTIDGFFALLDKLNFYKREPDYKRPNWDEPVMGGVGISPEDRKAMMLENARLESEAKAKVRALRYKKKSH